VEKEGTFTNLQGRVQRIHQAYPPKGQAVSDLEVFRRIGAALFPQNDTFRSADPADITAELALTIPADAGAEAAETW
jgi:predicted molibdopterin-dependent oxidoreductase YjgC